MKKKKELIIILGSLLVVVLSVTLAYFTTEIFGTGKDISLDSANLKITFSSGSGNISGVNIEPGWSSGASTFTVKNESNDTYKYNIVIKDLINTFVTKGFLLYKITSTDGGYNMSDFKDVPKSSTQKDKVLAYSVEIAKGATHTYNVEFKYENSSEVDQSDDMGKILSGTLFIEKGTEKPATLAEKLLEDNPTISERIEFISDFTANTEKTLYKATEMGISVYYFAGSEDNIKINNWVKFAGYYWRIIRTNHDGSIRILYFGTNHDSTQAYIGKSAYWSSDDNPMYVGYMWGTTGSLSNNRTNENDSLIKQYIDNWYDGTKTIVNSNYQEGYTDTSANKLIDYAKYISTEAIYCNDRSIGSGTYNVGSEYFDYGAYTRIKTNKKPSYDCGKNTNDDTWFDGNQSTADMFTHILASNGNNKLKYPIALMTVDEVMYISGKATFKSWYINNSASSTVQPDRGWLLSSSGWSSDIAYSWAYQKNSTIVSNNVSSIFDVRPVISIKADALWSKGNGSPENPYEIVYN